MSISVFIESNSASMGNYNRQVLLVPIDGDVRVYSRQTDGLKGPQNKWELTDLETVINSIDPSEVVTAEPVGVYVTKADYEAIEDKGYSPVLTTKSISAHKQSSRVPHVIDPVVSIRDLYEQVNNGDASLADRVIDGRRQTNVVINNNVNNNNNMEVSVPNTNIVHAALASIPRKELAERYVHRNVMGDVEDFKVFDFARANGVNVLIYGPTGPGKTTAVEAWAAERGLRMATVSGSAALEPSHLFGKYIPTGEGNNAAWIDGPITDCVRNGGVILFDEVNFIGMKIITPTYSLLDGRRSITLLDHRGEVIQAHPDLTIFATMNPDYIGTGQLNAAFRNRFDIQIPWDYDDKVESKLVKSKNLLALAKQLRDEAAKGQYETPIATNMLIEFGELVSGLGYAFAVENFIAHFSTEEQASVRMVFQTHEYNIKPDFGLEVAMPNINIDGSAAPTADQLDAMVNANPSTVQSPSVVTI